MDKPDINNMLYFIVPQGQESTEIKNSNIQEGSSRTQSGIQNLRNRDLLNKYEQYINPLKKNGVEPSYFPYIKKLPGKVKISGDKSFRKLVNKHHRGWKERYPPEKYPLDSSIFDRNMLNLIKPGPIPGFDSAEYGLVEDRRSISGSSTQITSHNNIRQMSNYTQAELSSHGTLLDEDKSHEKKKKKKRRHEMDYDGERKRKHKYDKEHRKNGTDGEYKKKKRKKDKEKEREKYY